MPDLARGSLSTADWHVMTCQPVVNHETSRRCAFNILGSCEALGKPACPFDWTVSPDLLKAKVSTKWTTPPKSTFERRELSGVAWNMESCHICHLRTDSHLVLRRAKSNARSSAARAVEPHRRELSALELSSTSQASWPVPRAKTHWKEDNFYWFRKRDIYTIYIRVMQLGGPQWPLLSILLSAHVACGCPSGKAKDCSQRPRWW